MSEVPQSRAFHVAIADDWEASVPFGSYEAATRGVLVGLGQPIRTTTADGIQQVLDTRYSDLRLQLLVVELDLDAVAAAGIDVVRDDASGEIGIDGPLPSGDPTIVVRVIPVLRPEGRWIAPDLG
ncbi:MAG: hypothetical protein ACTHMQ_11125 [Protaetiibacter sp.]